MRYSSVIFVTVLTSLVCRSASYTVCGDDLHKKEEEEATIEIVKRLMGMRKPDWSWESPLIPINLQVTVPESFFGRNKTAKSMKNFIKSNFDQMSVGQKAASAIALRAMCAEESALGGINLMKSIAEDLDVQFPKESRLPRNGYTIGIASLCVNGYSIEPGLVDKLLDWQNKNGSFGDVDPVGSTVHMIPPMYCLSKMQNPRYNAKRVGKALKKMRDFLIENVETNAAGQTYIASEFWSSHALVSMWMSASPSDDPESWRCSDVARTLGNFPGHEGAIDLGVRLMRLHGKALYNVAVSDWKCVETDPIPSGYVPICNHDNPETCQPKPGPK